MEVVADKPPKAGRIQKQAASLRLNLSIKINNKYTVVWVFDEDIGGTNEITWGTQYEVFVSDTFKNGAKVVIAANRVDISPGLVATLDKTKVMRPAIGTQTI